MSDEEKPTADPEDMTTEQLAEQLWPNKDGAVAPPPEDNEVPDEVVPAVPAAGEVPAVEPPAPAVEAPDDDDLAALEKMQRELAERRRDEELALLKAHNSRLAGKLDFVQKKLESADRTRTESGIGTDIEDEAPGVSALREDLRKLKEEREAELRDQAIAAETQAFGARYAEAKYTPEELQAAGVKYAAEWQAALEDPNPQSARETTRLVLSRIATDVEAARLEKRVASAREKRAASTTRIAQERSSSSSVSGGVRQSIHHEKSPEDMTVEELAAELWPSRR